MKATNSYLLDETARTQYENSRNVHVLIKSVISVIQLFLPDSSCKSGL